MSCQLCFILPVAQMTISTMPFHAHYKVVSGFMVKFPHIAVTFRRLFASRSILRSNSKVMKTLSEGTLDPFVSSPAPNRVVANSVLDFLSVLALGVPALENEDKFLKAEGEGWNYYLSCKKYHPLDATDLFVQSGLMPFPRICFLCS